MMYELNQIVQFNAGKKQGWIEAKITALGLNNSGREDDMYEIILKEEFHHEYEWWVPAIDLRLMEK